MTPLDVASVYAVLVFCSVLGLHSALWSGLLDSLPCGPCIITLLRPTLIRVAIKF